jgi:ABC-type transporter Mla subunit MlaD
MNFVQALDAAGLVLLAGQAGWIGLLYRRMGRLRGALESAGEVVAQLDAASQRLDASAGGIVRKVRDGVAEVDAKLSSCRRLAQELTAASRNAEEVATRLDQALRQSRRLSSARAAAPPREAVEPLGFAQRLATTRPAMAAPSEAVVAAERILAAELSFAPALTLHAAELAEPDPARTIKLEIG